MLSRRQLCVCSSVLALGALHCSSSRQELSHTAATPGLFSAASGPADGSEGVGASGASQEALGPQLPATSSGSSVPSAAPPPRRAPLSDAQIVAVTKVAHEAEIEQGRLAHERARDERVRDLAAMMVDHHAEARLEQQRLSVAPTPHADSRRLEHEADVALGALRDKRAEEFDQAYLALQIQEHRRLLRSIEQELLPAARDRKLEAYLESLRPEIESHLALAERLQQELQGRSSLDPKASQQRGERNRSSSARFSSQH